MIRVRCWGTRGSIPAPGPTTAGYGGNTPCVEVRVGERRFIFDAGSGIRVLGSQLSRTAEEVEAALFLSHFHWDHIQGFPFFRPLYDRKTQLRIFGPEQHGFDIQTLFAGQMGPIYFPVPFAAVAANCEFAGLPEGEWTEDSVTVRSMRVRHPSITYGYRLESGGHSVCFIPDNELVGGEYDMDADWREQLTSFVAGADLLLHDAMFTEQEYPTREGWGHSTYRQVFDLAVEAGVKRLHFYHHDPERTDIQLSGIVSRFQVEAQRAGTALEIDAANEDREILLQEC